MFRSSPKQFLSGMVDKSNKEKNTRCVYYVYTMFTCWVIESQNGLGVAVWDRTVLRLSSSCVYWPFVSSIYLFTVLRLLLGKHLVQQGQQSLDLRYVYTLRLIGPISYLGACYIRTKVTKCIREKRTMYFRGLTIKSHSSGYEIVPINRSV